ncbi:uncharacterized protein ACA1_342290 [Acanthamoeba castellanii str. Neff]|uniref:Uncharacterized protein n=1 Tax=Acanthamoeba castellanii (strain ATCC 30010 / Neff) TaxID=1257118 RepID=L8HDA2_ACACF|nr:uncharacterized protein ACA1_342290 [Acanthamoeba castellanii str. Neff]ELR23145.1 hypothetical protein ACA1_342290 [Acanthamoeba castellanii str. Neff]
MLPHDDHPLVGQQDHVADKVAHYLQSITAANGGHGGVSVDTIDDLLARVKSAYMRLIESTPDDICTVTASTDEPDLLVPTEDGNAVEELIVTHLATAIPGPEDGVLPPPDPRDRSDSRVDDDREDAASAEGAGRERWMEWAEMDIGELLGDLEDKEDHTDQHWKRSANDQPTASSAGHQDTHNKQYQATEPRRPGTTLSSRLGEEIQSGEEFHPDSPSYEPPQPERQSFTFGPQQPSYQRGGPPGRPAIPASHTREDRPTERRSWAHSPENQRNNLRQGWGRSSDKRSHNNRPYRPRDTHCRAEAKRHQSHQHTHQHTHYEPRRKWHQSRSSPTHNYSQEHKHNKHMGTTSDATEAGSVRERGQTTSPVRRTRGQPITTTRDPAVTNGDGGRTSRSRGHQHELRANPTGHTPW